jgi:hypothetical protein
MSRLRIKTGTSRTQTALQLHLTVGYIKAGQCATEAEQLPRLTCKAVSALHCRWSFVCGALNTGQEDLQPLPNSHLQATAFYYTDGHNFFFADLR